MLGTNATCPYWRCKCGDFLDLGRSAYDKYLQCKDNYLWYGRKSDSADTLSKDPYHGYFSSATHDGKDPTQLMHTISTSSWSTGLSLLQNAGLGVLQASLPDSFTSAEQQQQLTGLVEVSNSWTLGAEPYPAMQDRPSSRGFHVDEISNGTLILNHPDQTLFNSSFAGIVNVTIESNGARGLGFCLVFTQALEIVFFPSNIVVSKRRAWIPYRTTAAWILVVLIMMLHRSCFRVRCS